MAEAVASDFSLADVGVTIDTRAEAGFGVVEMERDDWIEADECLDFLDRGLPTFCITNIVTRGKEVAGVDADCEAFRAVDAVVNGSDVAQLVAEASSLAGGILQRDAN